MSDAAFWKSEIFFERGLDTISENQTDGQISSAKASLLEGRSPHERQRYAGRFDNPHVACAHAGYAAVHTHLVCEVHNLLKRDYALREPRLVK